MHPPHYQIDVVSVYSTRFICLDFDWSGLIGVNDASPRYRARLKKNGPAFVLKTASPFADWIEGE
jgi:hypothetical protein